MEKLLFQARSSYFLTKATKGKRKMQKLPVIAVQLGMSTEHKYHFLSLMLSRQLETKEIVEVCDQMHAHFNENGPFMLREFVGKEIHLLPSPKSEAYFKTVRSAIEEYQAVLETLGLAEWCEEMVFDRNLRPFDERDVPHPKLQKQNDFDGFATSLLPD